MSKQPQSKDDTATLALPVPAPQPKLFRHKATNDILRLLVDNPYDTFTIRELSRLIDHSTYSTKSAVDVLEANGFVNAPAEGNRRPVGINRDRLFKPDDPVLQIPQSEFHDPVRAAIERLQSELDDVRGILVFGSVARGQADRQSDIDLWVLVAGSRAERHHGNEVAKQLSQQPFDGDRYTFQVVVETLDSAETYADRLPEIFTDAITLYETEALETLKREVLTNA